MLPWWSGDLGECWYNSKQGRWGCSVCAEPNRQQTRHMCIRFSCVCVYTDSYKTSESRFLLKAQHCGAVMMTYLPWGCRSTPVTLYSVIALPLLLVQVLETGLVLCFCMVLCLRAELSPSQDCSLWLVNPIRGLIGWRFHIHSYVHAVGLDLSGQVQLKMFWGVQPTFSQVWMLHVSCIHPTTYIM